MYNLIKKVMKWWSEREALKKLDERTWAIAGYCSRHDCQTCHFADAELNCKIQEEFPH